MVSSQAHNLIKVVRFNLLQMLYLGSLLLFSTVLLAPPHMKKLYLAIVTIVVLFICVIDLSFIWATLKILSISNWELLFIVTIFLLGLWSLVLMGSSEFEIIVLIILLLLGSIFIVCTNQLVIIYLAIELQTFSLFVLMAKNKKSLKSAEGALKYFVLGAISSGIYLLGLSLISYEGAFMTLGDLGLF
jgi:NADH-quinone oxidoreductase subunit N